MIIEALFSRRNDSETRAAYHKVADELFGNAADDSALAAQKTKLRMVLMRLMNDRMQRSRAHVAVKAGKGTAADEARLADVDPLAPLREQHAARART